MMVAGFSLKVSDGYAGFSLAADAGPKQVETGFRRSPELFGDLAKCLLLNPAGLVRRADE